MTTETLIYWCDLFGVAVFAISGVMAARQLQMDPFGALILAGVTAIGGGTLRDVLLGFQPFWISDNNYLYVILLTTIVSMGVAAQAVWHYRILNLADAFGLALFTVLGMSRAMDAEVTPLVATVMGVRPGVGRRDDTRCPFRPGATDSKERGLRHRITGRRHQLFRATLFIPFRSHLYANGHGGCFVHSVDGDSLEAIVTNALPLINTDIV